MIDVQTQAEHDAEYVKWRDMWRRWCWRGRRQDAEPSLYPREIYIVTYDEPDAEGFWGRRLEMQFYVRGADAQEERSAHDQVWRRFAEVMHGRPHVVYRVCYS